MSNYDALASLILTLGAFTVLTLVCYWVVIIHDIWRRRR